MPVAPMPKQLTHLKVALDESIEEKLQILSPGYGSYRILRKSVDARSRAPHWVFAVEVFEPGESPAVHEYPVDPIRVSSRLAPVLIVGAGPAGLFAALRLCERGIPCKLIEQGSKANERMKSIAAYWRYGKLEPKNNVCFGEGGAGLYSDGKLITRIKSPYIPYVLNRLVRFGAPEEIQYLANPHVGSDKIRKVIPPMREHLRALGCEVLFDTKVEGLIYAEGKVCGVKFADGTQTLGSAVILATGHSATDMLYHLNENGVAMEGKSFALGLRIEHPQKEIDRIQYRDFAGHPKLGAANYRLADHQAETGIGVYSFCMCPGGYVIASGTEADSVVSNGMSNYARNSPYANAAVVVSVDHATFFGNDLFGGLNFRRELELAARGLVTGAGGTRQFPAQRTLDFMDQKLGKALPSSSPSGVVPARLDTLLPRAIYHRLTQSLETFQNKMAGFLSPSAQFHGIESRTSCPVRVIRDEDSLQSISHTGLYPTGEGAGYAGGITSAAVDGIRVAEAIVTTLV
jgi:uncharacterized FAD-dependent dehydrogenase